MKKIFILATAAIVSFASCMKSEVVYNQGQQEIGFRQFTGSMTKANEALSGYASTMGVFAYHNGSTAYINNGSFKETTTTGTWGGDPTKYYWPLQGTLDFTVYAPHQATGVDYVLNDKKLKVTIADNSGEQIDYLYGKVWYNEKTKAASPVPVVLKHALSKVTIAAKANAASIFKVTSIKLMQTIQEGSYTVTYNTTSDDFTSVVEGSSTATKKDMEYVSNEWNLTTELTANTASKLVVPSDQTSIVLSYTMAGNSTLLTATVNLASESAKWETGKHYTYNLTLTADEILFVPTVQDWDNQAASGIDVK